MKKFKSTLVVPQLSAISISILVSIARIGESPAPGGVRGFQDGLLGEGGGLAVRLMSGQRMDDKILAGQRQLK